MYILSFLLQLEKLEEAIQDCTKAIELDDTYLKAYMRRAKWLVNQYSGMILRFIKA